MLLVLGEGTGRWTTASRPSFLAVLQRKVDKFVDAVMACHDVPAMSLSVVRDGQVVVVFISTKSDAVSHQKL